MADTVYTKVLKGEIPGHILYQDDICFAILAIQPNNPGHVLVIPVQQIANWEELPIDIWLHVARVAQSFAKIIKRLYKPPKVAIASVGFEIPHVHIHVFSLFEIKDMANIHPKIAKPDDLTKEANKIRAEIKNQDIAII